MSEVLPRPTLVLSLPVDPAVLCRAVQSSANRGQFDAPIYRFAGVVPAGTVTIVNLMAREGFVGVMVSPVSLYSSIHDPRIVVRIYIDDSINATPDGLPMTVDGEIPNSQYWLVYYGIRFEVTNTSPFDVLLTLDSQAGVVEKTLFDKFYLPMLTRFSYDPLYRMVEETAVGG